VSEPYCTVTQSSGKFLDHIRESTVETLSTDARVAILAVMA
jgi:hypothetical protein